MVKMQNVNALVLDIVKQDNTLRMSISEAAELSLTIKRYSEQAVNIKQINCLCDEVTSILNKAEKKCILSADQVIQLRKIGQLFWDILLTEQVKKKLVNSSNRDLVLSLDEELIRIPWELIHDGDNYLCLKFGLGRVVRTKESVPTVEYRGASNILKMLILANPTDDLKSAYTEGVLIKNQFEKKRKLIQIDFKSNRIDTLYVKKNLRDYDIVHFAGHCDYDLNDSANIGWRLKDGRFTAKDILALSESLTLPSLVFSNACNSALALEHPEFSDYHERTYSLASAFLFSGVRHYIGSVWRLEDSAGLIFARKFYEELIKGKTIGESLRLSRHELLKEYGITNISWASYILYGDPNFILFNLSKNTLNLQNEKKIYRFPANRIKKFAPFLISFLILLSIAIIYPIKNPQGYFLYWKAGNLLQKGRNKEVINISRNVISRNPSFLGYYPVIAKAYERLGDKANSLKYYYDYAFYSQKKGDNKKLASAYINIGWIYQMFGEYVKAFEFYNKAFELARSRNDALNEAASLRKLAVWHVDKENYDKALELLMKALKIDTDNQSFAEHKYNLACDYFDIGLVYVNKDDIPAAREFYNKSSQLFRDLKQKHELNDYYFNLGELSLLEKEYSKTLEYYLKGLEIDLQQNNQPSIATDYNMIGELYLEMGDFAKAEEYFEKALDLSKKIDSLPELAAVYYNYASLYKQKKQKNNAKEFLRLAQEIYHRMDSPMYKRIRQEFAELLD